MTPAPETVPLTVTVEHPDGCPPSVETWPCAFRDREVAERFAAKMERLTPGAVAYLTIEGEEAAWCDWCGWPAEDLKACEEGDVLCPECMDEDETERRQNARDLEHAIHERL